MQISDEPGKALKCRSKRALFAGIGLFITIYLLGIVMVPSTALCFCKDIVVSFVEPISNEQILPDSRPKAALNGQVLSLSACPGEFKPASFVLRPSQRIENLSVEVSNLRNISEVIPASNVSVRVVKVWFQGAGAWDSKFLDRTKPPALVPELLLKDDSLIQVDHSKRRNFIKLTFSNDTRYVDISNPKVQKKRIIYTNKEFPVKDTSNLLPLDLEKDEARQFWISIRVPADCPAGTYEGSIDLKTTSGSLCDIPLAVRVLPFKLEAPRLIYSLYYRGKLWFGPGTVSSEYKNRVQLKAELLNMMDHGIRNPTVYQLNRNSQSPPKMPQKKRYKLFKEYLAIRQEVGMTDQPLYLAKVIGTAKNEAALRRLSAEVKQLVRIVRPFGVTALYLYGEDEARDKELLAQRWAWQTTHAAGAKVFASGYRGDYKAMGALTDLLVLHGSPSLQDARNVHRFGNKIFCYHNPQSGPENPLTFRRNYGIDLWRAEYDGAMIYAYQHAGGGGSIWNDFDSVPTRDHNLTYPTTDGVIDTLAWEGLREAVDDVRYITTLEKLIKSAKSSRDAETKYRANLAQLFLAKLRTNNQADPSIIRRTVIKYIVDLQGANG